MAAPTVAAPPILRSVVVHERVSVSPAEFAAQNVRSNLVHEPVTATNNSFSSDSSDISGHAEPFCSTSEDPVPAEQTEQKDAKHRDAEKRPSQTTTGPSEDETSGAHLLASASAAAGLSCREKAQQLMMSMVVHLQAENKRAGRPPLPSSKEIHVCYIDRVVKGVRDWKRLNGEPQFRELYLKALQAEQPWKKKQRERAAELVASIAEESGATDERELERLCSQCIQQAVRGERPAGLTGQAEDK